MKKLFIAVIPLLLFIGLGLGIQTEAQTATGQIVVKKVVVNNSNTSAVPEDSVITLNAPGPSIITFRGDASGTVNTIQPGSYSITETPGTGFTVSYSSGCNGSITAGQTVTCTVTNTAIGGSNDNNNNDNNNTGTATLRVIKVVRNLPGSGNTKSAGDFDINITGTNVSQSTITGNTSGATVTLSPGSYNVSEPSVSGYHAFYSPGCSGTIASGQAVTCTITNFDSEFISHTQGNLLIVKNVINDNGGTGKDTDFTIHINGINPSVSPTAGDATGSMVRVNPGAYSIDEVQTSGYSKTLSAGCSGTVAAGEVKTCIITNNDNIAGAGDTGGLPGMPQTGTDGNDMRPLMLATIMFVAAMGVMYIRYRNV